MLTRIRNWFSPQGSEGENSGEVHRIRGLRVELHNSRPDIKSQEVLFRLSEALELIERYQPRRFRRLSGDIKAIRIERFPTRGAFLPQERVILTELTFLARRDISAAPVASSILHEGVHARVHAFRNAVSGGLRGQQSPGSMAREERMCRRAELEFGRSLPSELGAPVIERAEASLALVDADVAPVINWEVAQARVEAVDRMGGFGKGE